MTHVSSIARVSSLSYVLPYSSFSGCSWFPWLSLISPAYLFIHPPNSILMLPKAVKSSDEVLLWLWSPQGKHLKEVRVLIWCLPGSYSDHSLGTQPRKYTTWLSMYPTHMCDMPPTDYFYSYLLVHAPLKEIHTVPQSSLKVILRGFNLLLNMYNIESNVQDTAKCKFQTFRKR